MDKSTLRKVDELIARIDGPCDCGPDDYCSCELCHIMGLLWEVHKDIESHILAVQGGGELETPEPH